MVGRLVTSISMVLISLMGSIFAVSVSTVSSQWVVFGQNGGNSTDSLPLGSIERTNLDIPSLNFVLPDGSDTSADFRSIYFDSAGKTIYAYYDDYGIPEVKPKLKSGDTFTLYADVIHPGTQTPSSISITISKIISGAQSGNFTQMKLASPVNITSAGNIYKLPDTAPGDYILDTFVNYPFGGIVMVYTMQIQVSP